MEIRLVPSDAVEAKVSPYQEHTARSMLKKLARNNERIKEAFAAIEREEDLLEDQWEKDFQ